MNGKKSDEQQLKANNSGERDMKQVKEKVQKPKKTINFLLVFLFINLIILLGSLYLIYDLPRKAEVLKSAKIEALKIEESSKVDLTGLEIIQNKKNWEILKSYFPDEVGVIKFITDLETLKKNEIIKDMSFVSQDAVRDKTGALGIPFIMEIEGSWDKVDAALKDFYDLPYLVRVINVDATVLEDGSVNFKFGGFIYVSESLDKNR
ncbi:MAG TPA: hypothetical protein VI819_04945 [Patescibacteria group bacterium]|nr:hypothetical protein [Patescibacteria group bacterium]